MNEFLICLIVCHIPVFMLLVPVEQFALSEIFKYSQFFQAYILGMIIVPAIYILTILNYFPIDTAGFSKSGLIIQAFMEELSKAAVLFLFVRWHNIRNRLGAFFFGLLIGLSFGTAENLLYLLPGRGTFNWHHLLWLRIYTTPFLHAFCTGIAGAMIWDVRKKNIAGKFFLAVLISGVIHYLWNIISAYTRSDAGIAFLSGIGIAGIYLLTESWFGELKSFYSQELREFLSGNRGLKMEDYFTDPASSGKNLLHSEKYFATLRELLLRLTVYNGSVPGSGELKEVWYEKKVARLHLMREEFKLC